MGASIPKIIFNEKVTFYKWAEEKMVKGEGIVKILETREEKKTGVKHIMKRQTETQREKYIDRNEINNMNILEIDVKKIYIC